MNIEKSLKDKFREKSNFQQTFISEMNERYISCFEQVNEMKSLIKSIRFIKVRFRGNEMDGCYLRKIDIIYGCCLIKKKDVGFTD